MEDYKILLGRGIRLQNNVFIKAIMGTPEFVFDSN